MNTFKIYFFNLNEDTQKEYLKFHGISSLTELNLELQPIAQIPKETQS
jgi:hypothetical protein